MPKARYKEIYFDILDRMNILPENPDSEDGGSLYTMDDAELNEDNVTPSDPAYNPIAIFTSILDAEAETINGYLSIQGHGRKGGELNSETDKGFVVILPVAKQGAVLPARIGKIGPVEVAQKIDSVAPDQIAWVVAEPAAMTLVSDYNDRAKLLDLEALGIFDPLYALNDDETRIWFSGESCRVTFTAYQRRAVPKDIAELIAALKEECPAPEELISAIKDIGQGALTPREGDMTGAAAYLTNRGRSSLTREQIKNQTKPPVVLGQKTDS